MFAGGIPDKEALEFIKNYLLGENWHTVNPLSHDQTNTILVEDILYKYSREYRKELKRCRRNTT